MNFFSYYSFDNDTPCHTCGLPIGDAGGPGTSHMSDKHFCGRTCVDKHIESNHYGPVSIGWESGGSLPHCPECESEDDEWVGALSFTKNRSMLYCGRCKLYYDIKLELSEISKARLEGDGSDA